ncbi:MAG: hypothetical protein JSR62_06460 [Nitrospira sp.]|nr:hypothetical protein [Nitrospira sp.]
MAMTITLVPKAASLTIGDDYEKTNTLEFTIQLTGDEPVWLTLEMPVGDTGVLRRSEDGNDIRLDSTGPAPLRCIPADSGTAPMKAWSLGDPDGGVPVAGSSTVSVKISHVLCRAKEGLSEITVIGTVGSLPSNIIRKLPITKAKPTTAPSNPILYFTAEPTFMIGRGTVTLAWEVVGDHEASLQTPLGQRVASAKSPFTESLDRTGTYTLTVNGKRRQAAVNVLTTGWHKLYPLGRQAFPSVLFDSGGKCDDALYAIFVRADEKTGRQAVLCKSTDGLTSWKTVNDAVPDGMESSPGLRLGNRLWLIGGSAVDWDQKSKRICYYDLEHPAKGWRDATVTGADGFKERMGHACVVVDDSTLWVMGGLGPYACLADVWEFKTDNNDRSTLHGTEKKGSSEGWRPRCLFSAVNFNKMIWVCGGVSSPNGNPLGDLWVTTPSKTISWTLRPKGSEGYVVAKAIGTGAAGCGDTLFTVVTNRTGGPSWTIAQAMWSIHKSGITSTSDTWHELPDPEFSGDGTNNPHGIAVVGVQNRLYLRTLHKHAMQGKVVGAPLFVYVRPI